MRIHDCSLTRSLAHARAWHFHMEINGFTFDGWFEDFGGFLAMMKDCAKFFAVRHGLLRVRDAGLTRPTMPGDGRMILPGDKAM